MLKRKTGDFNRKMKELSVIGIKAQKNTIIFVTNYFVLYMEINFSIMKVYGELVL